MSDTRPFPEFTPEQRQAMREKAARFFRPMPEEDDVSMWIDATPEQRGRALRDVLSLVDAIGHYPAKPALLRWIDIAPRAFRKDKERLC